MTGKFFYFTKIAYGLACLTLVLLASLHFVFGVSPVITLTIIISFLIVLVAAAGCALHLRELERVEEAEVLDKMSEKVNLHLQIINDVLNPAKNRLLACEAEMAAHATLFTSGAKNIVIARRIIEALEERLDTLMTLSQSKDPELLVKAHDLSDSKLMVTVDMIRATISADPIPGLESHLWRDTIDMLLIQIERQLRGKSEVAA